MSAMSDMSRAIREEVQKHAATIPELPDDVLREFAAIVMAFGHDLSDELRRRERNAQERAHQHLGE